MVRVLLIKARFIQDYMLYNFIQKNVDKEA